MGVSQDALATPENLGLCLLHRGKSSEAERINKETRFGEVLVQHTYTRAAGLAPGASEHAAHCSQSGIILQQGKHAQPERTHRKVFWARWYLGIRIGSWLRAIWIAPSRASGSTPRSSEPCRAGHAQCAYQESSSATRAAVPDLHPVRSCVQGR